LYIPVLLLHNFFISIGFYDPNIIYHGVYVVQWDVWYYFKKILLALLFCGKEPLLDAMWFVYVLFLALCGLSLLSYFAKKICRDKINYLSLRFFVLLLLVTVSCILTKVYDITIFRISCTITGMWLIYLGMLLRHYKKITFDNSQIAMVSALIAWGAAITNGGLILVDNIYNDVISLSITSCACLYVICFISRTISGNVIGKVLKEIGKESFVIMAFHLIAFKALTLILFIFGIDERLGLTYPNVGDSSLLLLYTIIGIFLPLLFVKMVRYIPSTIRQIIKSKC